MTELVIQSGKLQGKRLLLPAKEMVVGRDKDCDLRIGSASVSRKHCVIKNSSEGILVTDLGSQNGTHVNDVPIKAPTLLREGDVLRIGSTLLSVPMQKSKVSAGSSQTKVSDNEIADWLMDTGSNYTGTDTAIISGKSKLDAGSDTAKNSVPSSTPAAVPLPPKQPLPTKVLSIKDEAAAVIRKHWETVKANQKK